MQLKIEGIESTIQALEAVKDALADKKIERVLMNEAAIPLKEEVAYRAPRRTGALSRAVVARVSRYKPHQPSVFVAVDFKLIPIQRDWDKRANRYPYIVEYGAKPGIRRPLKGLWLYAFGKYRVRQIKSGGFAGRQYFRGAIRDMRPRIVPAVEDGLRNLLRFADHQWGPSNVTWGQGGIG